MAVRTTIAAALIVCTLCSVEATAQGRFDVGLLLGSTNATDEGSALQFDRGTTYQATFAWRVWRTDDVNLSIEVPFIASPAFTVTTPGPSLPLEYASLYLTPGVRVIWAPKGPVSFFGAIGGGYARYSESKLKADRSANPGQRDTNAGALQLGGGVDVRGFGWLGFRGELRDVYTGARNFSVPTPGEHVHNVIGSGGLVIRF
jgi:hypothetical protein